VRGRGEKLLQKGDSALVSALRDREEILLPMEEEKGRRRNPGKKRRGNRKGSNPTFLIDWQKPRISERK